jgi:hypothetical protein
MARKFDAFGTVGAEWRPRSRGCGLTVLAGLTWDTHYLTMKVARAGLKQRKSEDAVRLSLSDSAGSESPARSPL